MSLMDYEEWQVPEKYILELEGIIVDLWLMTPLSERHKLPGPFRSIAEKIHNRPPKKPDLNGSDILDSSSSVAATPVIPILVSSPHPWASFAGTYEGEVWEELLTIIERQRAEVPDEHAVLLGD